MWQRQICLIPEHSPIHSMIMIQEKWIDCSIQTAQLVDLFSHFVIPRIEHEKYYYFIHCLNSRSNGFIPGTSCTYWLNKRWINHDMHNIKLKKYIYKFDWWANNNSTVYQQNNGNQSEKKVLTFHQKKTSADGWVQWECAFHDRTSGWYGGWGSGKPHSTWHKCTGWSIRLYRSGRLLVVSFIIIIFFHTWLL